MQCVESGVGQPCHAMLVCKGGIQVFRNKLVFLGDTTVLVDTTP